MRETLNEEKMSMEKLNEEELNEEKLNTDFDKWFTNQYKTDSDKIQYRTINYLPQMEYSYANFLTFMNERRKLLKAELLKILL